MKDVQRCVSVLLIFCQYITYCKTNCFRKEVGHLISLGHGRSHRILSFISETYTGISQNNKHHDSARHEKSISVL